jgi:hypothetical protein
MGLLDQHDVYCPEATISKMTSIKGQNLIRRKNLAWRQEFN